MQNNSPSSAYGYPPHVPTPPAQIRSTTSNLLAQFGVSTAHKRDVNKKQSLGNASIRSGTDASSSMRQHNSPPSAASHYRPNKEGYSSNQQYTAPSQYAPQPYLQQQPQYPPYQSNDSFTVNDPRSGSYPVHREVRPAPAYTHNDQTLYGSTYSDTSQPTHAPYSPLAPSNQSHDPYNSYSSNGPSFSSDTPTYAGDSENRNHTQLPYVSNIPVQPSPLSQLQQSETIEYTTPTRRSNRECRPRVQHSLSDLGSPASQPRSRKKGGKAVSDLLGYDVDLRSKANTRVRIRQEIASKTVAHRDAFLADKQDLFLPILPPNNYVQKIVLKRSLMSAEELAKLPTVTPYVEIEQQPRGVKAIMKPYQLSGLSFMMYLHHNGLSGVLGDEMGLGKTLQTLSLIQHLKENDPKAGTGRLQRPFLIVCPLSVLSSWMAETRKWTPGLKAIRFHGPVTERQRLKRIVVGEIDQYGNLTAHARSKLKSRRKAKGHEVISLDTDSEVEEDVGVDLVVTTYECFRAEQSWFKTAFVWRYVVLDEGHTVKNDASLISKSLQGLKAEYRLILTGTPLQNNLSELWALLHWLYPEVFPAKTSELFDTSFNLSKGQYSSKVLDDSRRLLELIMLRRMKTSPGVDLNLPPKTEVLLFVPLSPMQVFWYKRMITKAEQSLLDELFKDVKGKEEIASKLQSQEAELTKMEADAVKALDSDAAVGSAAWQEMKAIVEQTIQRDQEVTGTESKKGDWRKLMNLLMQLRKVCNHPYQLHNAEPEPYYSGGHVITASGKFIVLEKLVKELVVKQKKQILIFSGFTKMLDLVEELLALRGGNGTSFRSMRIDGSTCRARRNLAIRLFNDLDTDVRVMLISTRAGGLGINLATASDVILLDQDWNPQITLQAEARAHRIGQKNPVTIYKLVSAGTVEEQMMGRIQKKLYLSAKVTEAMEDIHTKFGTSKSKKRGGEDEDNLPQLSTNQLMTLLRRGAAAISRPEVDVNEMLSWDWETTVAKCKDNPADLAIKQDTQGDVKFDEEAERKWLSEMECVEATIFEGKTLSRKDRAKSNKEVAQEAQELFNRADRRVGKNTTVMVDGYAVSKESVNCAWGEAIPTLAGKDPSLAEPKRAKKVDIEPQEHCQVCVDGGTLEACRLCPRAYHYDCLDRDYQSKAKGWQFNCPQHKCYDCGQSTSEAGGMLYRCRFCEKAYCEDCINMEKTTLIGNNLMEYELLGYPEMTQAFYVVCSRCTEHWEEIPEDKKLCENLSEGIRLAYESRLGADSKERSASTLPGSMTDATTVETTGANTPIVIDDDEGERKAVSKRRQTASELPDRSTKKRRNFT